MTLTHDRRYTLHGRVSPAPTVFERTKPTWHNLFGERFAERQGDGRQRAWHSLGQTFTERLTAEEALAKAGMLYTIRKFPMQVDLTARDADGNPRKNAKGEEAPLKSVPVPGLFGIMRSPVSEDPEPRLLGTVGPGYTLLQNIDIARMIDKHTCWTVETIGALGNGETFFAAMSMGGYEVKGDEIKQYAVISDQRDGKGAFSGMATSVRTVCQNTWLAGIAAATSRVTLTHSQALAAEAEEVCAIFSQLEHIQAEGREMLTALADLRVTEETAKAVIEAVYPYKEMPAKVRLAMSVDGKVDTPELMKGKKAWEQSKDLVDGWRDKTFDLYERFNDEFPQSAGTGYAVVNAVSEHTDHYQNARNDRTRAESAVFGERSLLKARAFELVNALR